MNQETRTAKVRVEIPNPTRKLSLGMFVEIEFARENSTGSNVLVVPEQAVQRVGERTIVFVTKKNEAGHFEVRDVELGGEVANGYRRIITGLSKGEEVVSKGSFALKTQLLKNQLGEE